MLTGHAEQADELLEGVGPRAVGEGGEEGKPGGPLPEGPQEDHAALPVVQRPHTDLSQQPGGAQGGWGGIGGGNGVRKGGQMGQGSRKSFGVGLNSAVLIQHVRDEEGEVISTGGGNRGEQGGTGGLEWTDSWISPLGRAQLRFAVFSFT